MAKNSDGEKFPFFQEARLEISRFALSFEAFDSELLAKKIRVTRALDPLPFSPTYCCGLVFLHASWEP